ncbi:hypothetical protein [Clostridium tertium]|uniref:Uncharacterized protein n=1 Tax=Clostridium tertium TaxID=1559 RepID=A0A6N2ZZK3_9CLOT
MGFITGKIIDVLIIIATIIIGIYAYDEIRRQDSSLKVMLIGIGIILFAIVNPIFILKMITGILGFITIIYGAKKNN